MTHHGATLFAVILLSVVGCSSSSTLPDGGTDGGIDAAPDTSVPDDTAPDGTAPDIGIDRCPNAGEVPFEPGCGGGGGTPIEAGCYQPCAGDGDTSCTGGLVCTQSWVNPCVCFPGETCCEACGSDQWLCLPPPPTDCAGRSFCECNSGCVPLVDLSTGCICDCDDPFNCTGMMCDCACGGATYLDCAAAGQCAETQVDCGDCDTVMVEGCPTCECAP